MPKTTITYNVYALNVYGSDVVQCDTLEQARKEAQEWKKETMEIIVIEKVTKEVIETLWKYVVF